MDEINVSSLNTHLNTLKIPVPPSRQAFKRQITLMEQQPRKNKDHETFSSSKKSV